MGETSFLEPDSVSSADQCGIFDTQTTKIKRGRKSTMGESSFLEPDSTTSADQERVQHTEDAHGEKGKGRRDAFLRGEIKKKE